MTQVYYSYVNIYSLTLITLEGGYYFANPPVLPVVNWILRGHGTHEVNTSWDKNVDQHLSGHWSSSFFHIVVSSYLCFLVSFTLFFSPFMNDFPLESDCPIQPNLHLVIHPVASGPAFSLSSTLPWTPALSFGDLATLFITSSSWYPRLSIPKHFSAEVVCIDAIAQDKTWISSLWPEVMCFSFASRKHKKCTKDPY